jgi:hypothetical protein
LASRAEPISLRFFFLMHGWRFLEQVGHEAMIRDDGIGSGQRLLSGAREYRATSDAVNTQFSASRKIVCRLNQKLEALI